MKQKPYEGYTMFDKNELFSKRYPLKTYIKKNEKTIRN